MNTHRFPGRSLLLAAALGVAWLPAHAGQSCGYAYSSDGKPVRDNYGECVRNNFWTPAKAIEACDPDLVAKPAPKPAPVAAPTPPPAPKPAPKPVMKTITLGAGALFDTNSASLKAAGRAQLDELVSRIHQLASIRAIHVDGYTDSRGSAAYNQKLSERRAAAVRDYLVNQGIDPALITIQGHGENDPVADNATAAGRAKNRRVEIHLDGVEQVMPGSR